MLATPTAPPAFGRLWPSVPVLQSRTRQCDEKGGSLSHYSAKGLGLLEKTMVDRKSKMVSFRVSPGELQSLQIACSTRGLRSISELARTSMQCWMSLASEPRPLDQQVDELRTRLQSLTEELEQIWAAVRGAGPAEELRE